jgi:hypothetical protein
MKEIGEASVKRAWRRGIGPASGADAGNVPLIMSVKAIATGGS